MGLKFVAVVFAVSACGAPLQATADAGASACAAATRIDASWKGTYTINETFSFDQGLTQVAPCVSNDARPSVAFSWLADKDDTSSFKFAVNDNGKTDDLVIAVFPNDTCAPAAVLGCGGITVGSLKPSLHVDIRNGTNYVFIVSSKKTTPPSGDFTLRLGD